ncbi:MAG: dickkopf-related protein [Myxococcota bacterium]|nr:dickkopf-related protein [Myxococcota bacterium]
MRILLCAVFALTTLATNAVAKKKTLSKMQRAGVVQACSAQSKNFKKREAKRSRLRRMRRGAPRSNTTTLTVSTSKYHPDVVVIEDDGTILSSDDMDLCAAAQAFYRRFPDNRDFLFVFGQGGRQRAAQFNAYYQSYQNAVRGIGKPVFNKSNECGSAGRLLGLSNMNGTDKWKAYLAPALDLWPAGVIAHEIGHQWIAGLHRPVKGNRLTNPDYPQHWQPLVDTDASIMYGNNWIKVGKDKFLTTSFPIPGKFSKLDLYLMGLIPASEVKPFTVIQATSSKIKKHYASPGQSARGQAVTVTMADIQQIYGERSPSYKTARKQFRAAMILVVPKGETLKRGPSRVVNYLRKAIPRRLKKATGKRLTLATSLKCDADADCADDEFCNEGFLKMGSNRCSPKRAHRKTCTRAAHCQSGRCLVGVCAKPNQCRADSDCASNQYCGLNFVTKVCKAKRANKAFCTQHRQCQSNRCSWGRCK